MTRAHPVRFVLASALAALLALPLAARAADSNDDVDPEARALLDKMARTLVSAKTLRLEMVTAYDVVQDDGQKLEFGATRKVAVRRPDRARMDTVNRDGRERGLIFDGKQIAVFDLEDGVYATVDKSGTLTAAFEYYTEELGMHIPLSGLFSPDLVKFIDTTMLEIEMVGEEKIAGVTCDHVASRGLNADIQLWIERGDKPVPRRIVIRYKDTPGDPQFRADLSWELSPQLPDSAFAFTPPADAERIPFAPRPVAAAEEAKP